MPPKGRTVADAMEYIDDVARALDVHIKEQRAQDQEFDKRIVELEKSDIRAQGKLDAILDRLERKQTTWQVWGPALLGSAISVAAVIVAIIALGGKS